jgi:hypothetical protein
VKEIPLTKGYVTLVDDEDAEWMSEHCWQVSLHKGVPYAGRPAWDSTERRHKRCQLHRAILARIHGADAIAGKMVDHINRNPLDNRRENLRLCSRPQNQWNCGLSKRNTSGFKGLFYINRGIKRWGAKIEFNGKKLYLGYYHTKEEAARVRDEAAKKHHGEFAVLNFPERDCAS